MGESNPRQADGNGLCYHYTNTRFLWLEMFSLC